MSHKSEDDSTAHYSVQGETRIGAKVKGGHITEHAAKLSDGLAERVICGVELGVYLLFKR